MRSQFLVRRTRSLLKTSPFSAQRASISSSRPRKYPRKVLATSAKPPIAERSTSSAALTHSGPPANDDVPDTPPPEEPSDHDEHSSEDPQPEPEPGIEVLEVTEVGKPKRRGRPSKESVEPLPGGLDILWVPDAPANAEQVASTSASAPAPTVDPALPPPEVMGEIMTNLRVTLHPQIQHKASYAISGPTVEPTFALYCPIEGSDYVLDATVREMGRQANADVVVLDAAQLAAGESGHFGKSAAGFKPPQNPLHFSASSSRPSPRPSEAEENVDDNEYSPSAQQLTFHVMAPVPMGRTGRTVFRQLKGGSATSKMRALFDELINVQPPSSAEETPPRRPRIIYIRDFNMLADSAPTWYPALLASVRQRRVGAMARSSSPVFNPTTIVFGVTPPLLPSPATSSPRASGILQQFMQSRGRPPSRRRTSKVDYGESEEADQAREKRLMDRLRRWQKGDSALYDEIPRLSTSSSPAEESSGSDGQPEMIVMDGGDGLSGFSQIADVLKNRISKGVNNSASSSSSSEPSNDPFFRTSIVVPTQRQLERERACRIARRREINELTIRMAVAAVGGTLGKLDPISDSSEVSEGFATDQPGTVPESSANKVWDNWGNRIELWSAVRQVADRAVGTAIASQHSEPNSLDSLPVSWSDVFQAWDAHNLQKQSRKLWIQQSVEKDAPEEEGEGDKKEKKEVVDELVQQVKKDAEDGELDQYQQRLVQCIVDPASLRTTFDQVHLPPHTIDSVRTIVSLPLLHPAAFQSGILKDHSMTGCLLFGPPGTGKTLVVRALAKEAGSRMLLVQPSDVMDMYYGEAEKLVRAAFALARRLAPCVVFIDEIDALFGARERGGGDHAHRGTITEFMQEMDGLKSSKDDNIVIIGATNRPFDLDDAVLRRLPRRLLVDLPGERERKEILKILLRDEQLDTDVDLSVLARRTENFSGSDLKHLCVAAALDAVKERVSVPWRPSPQAGAEPVQEVASFTLDVVSQGITSTLAPSPEPISEFQSTQATSASKAPEEVTSNSSKSTTIEKPPQPSSTPGQVTKPIEDKLATFDSPSASSDATSTTTSSTSLPEGLPRTLSWRNFEVALKEITPSSSESHASLVDLRKWNEEFGEGRKGRKKHVWGKGKFGFTDKPLDGGEEVKIVQSLP